MHEPFPARRRASPRWPDDQPTGRPTVEVFFVSLLMSLCEDGFMQIKISGHHVSVTKAMEANIYEKFARVERHFDQINSMHVVLSLDNHHTDCSHKGQMNHKAEAIIRVPGAELFAQASADDMYVSIAMLSEKLDRQILKHKSRLRQH
jgi:putative sigma-54 modulation protein